MLYVTTRNKNDAFTAYRALTNDLAPDGGRFVPFRMPEYTEEEIAQLRDKTFGQTISEILNVFFSARLQPWNLDFCVGRNIFRTVASNYKIVIAELWHNLEGDFHYMENALYQVMNSKNPNKTALEWVRIAVRIATLFGIYGEMLRNDLLEPGQTFDISVPNDDFATPMAVWYSRAMGLPVHMIICSCENDGNMWDFIHRGLIATSQISESLELGLERLLEGVLGCGEVKNFRQAWEMGKAYSVDEEILPQLNQGLFCSVSGSDRIPQTINSVFRSSGYIIDPQTALCYGGLQDYRAKTGKSELTVLLAEHTPKDFTAEICEATGIPTDKLNDYINHF